MAILSSPTFDAPTEINQSTVRFGRTGTESSLSFFNIEDANHDGLLDSVGHFLIPVAGFKLGDVMGVLTAETVSGNSVTGSETVDVF